MITYIIALIIIVIAGYGLYRTIQHSKGNGGGCCGGGAGSIRDEKTLEGPIIAQKLVHIEGMTCENCSNRIQRAINRIDGVSADVRLKKKSAIVSYEKEVPDDTIREAIENLDYQVTGIEELQDIRKK